MADGAALFGTDGVRGKAGQGPLAPESVERLGHALAEWLRAHGDAGKPALIGGDTRASRGEITSALAAGLARRGIAAIDLGVLPTAALALLIDDYGASCAAVISASHNPADDNGIKIFTGHGAKFGDQEARFVEERWRACDLAAAGPRPSSASVLIRRDDGAARYLEHLLAAAGRPDLSGMKLALDLAHGAAHAVGPRLFRQAGAEVVVTGAAPDGRNINEGCGSLHPKSVAALVLSSGATFGLAVDGDADRSILADEQGAPVDGDAILALVADDLLERGKLAGKKVVGTVMSNFGLELCLRERGVGLVRTPVGDRHVSAALKEQGLVLGGEPSGHVIFGADLDYLGDGLYTALRVAEILKRRGLALSRAVAGYRPAPQVLEAVAVASRPPLETIPGFKEILSSSERRLGNSGRVVVRYSGTEPVVRVMVEGEEAALVASLARDLASHLARAIGVR
jgi:phosphoglucosamine mutase